MKAVLLVGGYGSRLRPLTIDTPKQMLQVVGLTMLERALDQLARHGVTDAVLSLGYLPEVFTDAYPDGYARGVKLHYAVETEPLDTAGAVKFAAETFDLTGTFFVVNGDVLTDVNLTALKDFHERNNALVTISMVPVEDPSSFGVVIADELGRVRNFIEKPPRDEAPSNLVNSGMYVFDQGALDHIPTGSPYSAERGLFPELALQGRLFGVSSDEYWIDAGTPTNLLKASMDILSSVRTGPEIPGAEKVGSSYFSEVRPEYLRSVTGPTFIGSHVQIREGAEVIGSILSDGCIIGAHAKVVNSVLMAGARIGSGSFVEGSIIGAGAVVPSDSMVLDGSVISSHAELSEGCRVEGERVPG